MEYVTAAQTALSFYASPNKMSLLTIYLRRSEAIACHYLKRMDEAEAYLLDALRSCLPHGFITPFVESVDYFSGLMERCLKREFQIAQLVTRGVPYREIAARFFVSEGRMRNMIKEIQGKLLINNKAELAKLIL
ncbi:MAG: LuxR C-terminal-related transcriptional regulator [Oscillospiraceae bacterium]|jgi:DNA-binding NarL/FixJ family response regulator|nr:LuxR C-terminal-related transcriptional regulator [Oscillospiraceae bacterium]